MTAHEKSWIFPFLCTICRLYKAVTKRYCFAEAFKKFLVGKKAIFADSHSEKLTSCSWRHCQQDVNEKCLTTLQHKKVKTGRILVAPQAVQVPIRMARLTRFVMKTLARARVRARRKEWRENLPATKAVSF